jgi:hypothetical protein
LVIAHVFSLEDEGIVGRRGHHVNVEPRRG